MPNPQSKNIDAGTRLQALALAEHGVPRHIITSLTSVTSPTIGRYQRQARDRGYNPDISHALLLSYVIDKPRSGRPRKCPLDEAALLDDDDDDDDDEGKKKKKKEESKSKSKSKSGKGRKEKIEGVVERREDGTAAIEDVRRGEREKKGEEEGEIDGDEEGSEEEEEERMNLDPDSLPPTAATTNFRS